MSDNKLQKEELENNLIIQEHQNRQLEDPVENAEGMGTGSEASNGIQQTDCTDNIQNNIPISEDIQKPENEGDLNGENNSSIEDGPLIEQSDIIQDKDQQEDDNHSEQPKNGNPYSQEDSEQHEENKDQCDMTIPSQNIKDEQSSTQLNSVKVCCKSIQSFNRFLKIFENDKDPDNNPHFDNIRLKATLTNQQYEKVSKFCRGPMSDYVSVQVMPVDNELTIPLIDLKIYFLPYLEKKFLNQHKGSISFKEKDKILTIKNEHLEASKFKDLCQSIYNAQKDIVYLHFFLKDIHKDALHHLREDKTFFDSPFFIFLKEKYHIVTYDIFDDTNKNNFEENSSNLSRNLSLLLSDSEETNSGLTRNSEIILFGNSKTELENAKNYLSEFEIFIKEIIFPDLTQKQLASSKLSKSSPYFNRLKKEIQSVLPSMFKDLFNSTLLNKILSEAKEKHLKLEESNRTSSQVRFTASGARHDIALFFKEWDEIINMKYKSTIFLLEQFKDQFIEKIMRNKINEYIKRLPKQNQDQFYCVKELKQENCFTLLVYWKDKSNLKVYDEIKKIKTELKRLFSLKGLNIPNQYYAQNDQLFEAFRLKKTACQIEYKPGMIYLIGTDKEIYEGNQIVQEHFSNNVLLNREYTFAEKIECKVFAKYHLKDIQEVCPSFAIIPNTQVAYPSLKYQIPKFQEKDAVTHLEKIQEEIAKEMFKSVQCCTVEQSALLDDERIRRIEEQLGVEVLSDRQDLSNIGHQVRALTVDPKDYSKFKVLESKDLQVTLIAGQPESIGMEELLLFIMINGKYLDSQAQLVVRTANVGQFVFKDITKYNSQFDRNTPREFEKKISDSSYGNNRNSNAVQNRDQLENNNTASSRVNRNYRDNSGNRNNKPNNQDQINQAQVYYASGVSDTYQRNNGGAHFQQHNRYKANSMVMYQSTSLQNFPSEKITFSILYEDFSNLEDNIKRFLKENITSSNFGLILPTEIGVCRDFLGSIRRLAKSMESNGDYAQAKHRPNLLLFCQEEKFTEIYSQLITTKPNELLLNQNYSKYHSPIVQVKNEYAYEDDQNEREFPGEISRLLNHLLSQSKLEYDFFYAMLPYSGRKSNQSEENDEATEVEQSNNIGEQKAVRIIIPPIGSDQKPILVKDNKEFRVDLEALLKNKNYGATGVIKNLMKAVKQAQNMKINFLISYMNKNGFCFDFVKVLINKNTIKNQSNPTKDKFKIVESSSDSNRKLQYVIRGRKQDVEEADRQIKTTLFNPFQSKFWDHKYVDELKPKLLMISKDTTDKLEQNEFQKYNTIFKKQQLKLLNLTFIQNMRLFYNFQDALREIHSKWEEKPSEKQDMCFTASKDILEEIYTCTEIGFDVRVHAGMNLGIDVNRFNSYCIALTNKPRPALRQIQQGETDENQYCLICKVITGHSLMFKEDMKDMKRLPKTPLKEKGLSKFYDSLVKEEDENNMAAVSDGSKANNPNEEDEAEEIDVVGIFDNYRIYPMYLAEYQVLVGKGYMASSSQNTDTQSN